jgi:hypothetical protein
MRESADRVTDTCIPLGAVVLLDPVLPIPFAVTALIMALVVVILVLRPPQRRLAAVQAHVEAYVST